MPVSFFGQYHGAAVEQWAMAPWLCRHARGACAFHGLQVAELQAQAESHGARILAVSPLWSRALAWAAREHLPLLEAECSAFAFVEGATLTWLRFASGRCLDIRQSLLRDATAGALQDWLHEGRGEHSLRGTPMVLAGYGVEGELIAPSDVLVLGEPSDEWPSRHWAARFDTATLNALPTPTFPGAPDVRERAGAWLAFASVVLLAVSVWSAGASFAQLHHQTQSLQVADQRARAHSVGAPAVAVAMADDPLLGQRKQAAQALSSALNHPWPQLLPALERSALGGVQWLAMEHVAGKGDLRLKGQAPDAASALGVAQVLGRQPGWSDVSVRRIQFGNKAGADAKAAEEPGVRFEIAAHFGTTRALAVGYKP